MAGTHEFPAAIGIILALELLTRAVRGGAPVLPEIGRIRQGPVHWTSSSAGPCDFARVRALSPSPGSNQGVLDIGPAPWRVAVGAPSNT